jgi:hypothetical protein
MIGLAIPAAPSSWALLLNYRPSRLPANPAPLSRNDPQPEKNHPRYQSLPFGLKEVPRGVTYVTGPLALRELLLSLNDGNTQVIDDIFPAQIGKIHRSSGAMQWYPMCSVRKHTRGFYSAGPMTA